MKQIFAVVLILELSLLKIWALYPLTVQMKAVTARSKNEQTILNSQAVDTETSRNPVPEDIKRRQRRPQKTKSSSANTLKSRFQRTVLYVENLNEPYWDEGDWVFQRTGLAFDQPKPTGALSTKDRKETEEWPIKEVTKSDMFCNLYCPVLYQKYGPICGGFLEGDEGRTHWKRIYRVQNFKNLCELERENCRLGDRESEFKS